jgi:hypothetical protein
MEKRPSRTVKVSVSFDRHDLATLRRAARASYGGSLSAALADAATWIRQQEARRQLVELLGGPVLTPESRAAIDAEIDEPRAERKKPRSRKAA